MTEESCLWGELSPVEEGHEEIADFLIIQRSKPVPIKIHEPCKEEEPAFEELPQECSEMEDTVMRTIKLLQYAKSMNSVIDKIKSKKSKTGDFKDIIPPLFPDDQVKDITHRPNPFRYLERISTPFMEGAGQPLHRLSEVNARLILRKCVSTIFAHIGYEDSTQVALDVMTDISEEYFKKFTRLLRVAVDHELLTGNVGFPDVMERVFHEMGIGSVLVMHNFYQDRILKYYKKTLEHCQSLASEYESLTTTTIKQEGEVIQIKKENEEDYTDVPELHVPALEDGTSADQLRPFSVTSLEQGFKMLQRIEQEEQLQNLVKEEKSTMKDSPKH